MAKKSNQSTHKVLDTSLTYIMPMVPETVPRRLARRCDEVKTTCKLTYDEKGHSYKVSSPGYYDKWFFEDLMDWYMYNGYLSVYEETI